MLQKYAVLKSLSKNVENMFADVFISVLGEEWDEVNSQTGWSVLMRYAVGSVQMKDFETWAQLDADMCTPTHVYASTCARPHTCTCWFLIFCHKDEEVFQRLVFTTFSVICLGCVCIALLNVLHLYSFWDKASSLTYMKETRNLTFKQKLWTFHVFPEMRDDILA